MRARLALVALALAVLPAACSEDDEGEVYAASLSGANERPTPVVTTATGTAVVTIEGNTINFQVNATGLSGTGATAAHIHAPGNATQVIGAAHAFTILNPNGLIASGSFTVPSNVAIDQDSLIFLIRNGLAYVNVHTAANVDGEIRGQLLRQ